MSRRKRVAFFAEDVTLAHAGRAAVLSRMLDPRKYETWLVTSPRYLGVLGPLEHFVPLRCMPGEKFLRRLAAGRPIFETHELAAAVEEDRSILRELRPDLVVGDFRVSLSISARSLSVPYLAISDSYWSPFAARPFPLPDIPLRRIGNRLAETLFFHLKDFGFAFHTRPFNKIRKRYRLPSIGANLPLAYSDADFVVYPDIPELIAKPNLPANHHHIGSVMFEPQVPTPPWWNDVPDRPSIYLSLGSSGKPEVVPRILSALGELPVNLFVATAGADEAVIASTAPRANIFHAHFLPGARTAARSSLMICNGGAAAQQAFHAGIPVLGVASNMDQLMNMAPIQARGAGLTVGTWAASAKNIRNSAQELLEDSSFRDSAKELRRLSGEFDARERFPRLLSKLLRVDAEESPRRFEQEISGLRKSDDATRQ